MFKISENPSIELLSSKPSLVKSSLFFASTHRISRVIINCINPLDISSIDSLSAEYKNIAVWVKIDKSLVTSPIQNYNNIDIIIRTSQQRGIDTNIHNGLWEIYLDIGEMPEDAYVNNEMIIWNLAFTRDKWFAFDSQISQLLDTYTTQDLMISNVLLSIDLIKEHPCNVYLCGGTNCHSIHGNVPRCITVNEKGDMYPYGLVYSELLMGNIFSETDVIAQYNSSKEKKHFIYINKKLYLSILDKCNYPLIPWFELLGGMISIDC